jgi:hypothetical protein
MDEHTYQFDLVSMLKSLPVPLVGAVVLGLIQLGTGLLFHELYPQVESTDMPLTYGFLLNLLTVFIPVIVAISGVLLYFFSALIFVNTIQREKTRLSAASIGVNFALVVAAASTIYNLVHFSYSLINFGPGLVLINICADVLISAFIGGVSAVAWVQIKRVK